MSGKEKIDRSRLIRIISDSIGVMAGVGGALTNPDTKLSDIGGEETLDKMLEDEQVALSIELLIAGILRHPLKITSSNKGERDLLEAEIKILGFRDLIYLLVVSKMKGMAVLEVIWGFEDGRYTPIRLKPLPIDAVEVNKDDTITYDGVDLSKYPRKFIIYRNRKYSNPYGVAELVKCYYPWLFKKAAWKYWLITTEKYSVPTLVAEYDANDVEDSQATSEELAEDFSNINSDAVVVTNNLKKLHILESKAKADEFKTLIDQCDASISKSILGTHVLTDTSANGSRALAEIHANINFRFKVQSAIKDVEDILNELLKWQAELNFGSNKYKSSIGIDYVSIQDWEKIREAIGMGIPVSKSQGIYLHVPEPRDDEDTFLAPEKVNLDNDIKTITEEGKSDTDTTRKKRDKKEETRADTSQDGNEQKTGE